MPRVFNTTADCKPDIHYMVKLDERLVKIKKLIDDGAYFTINRARQYGKTTTLRALSRYLQGKYYPVLLDFQNLGAAEFEDENTFALSFARIFMRAFRRNALLQSVEMEEVLAELNEIIQAEPGNFRLLRLFEKLGDICAASDKKIVLMIDEVDSASNNQVFLDFLAQLRAYYIDRDVQPTFQSVILAGVNDIRNLKRKVRPEDEHKVNSPWNIAADFKVDMSFSKAEIAEMLTEYEKDYRTGMDIHAIAGLLYDYTSGYPFLVSRLCQLMDETVWHNQEFGTKALAWTKAGVQEAVKKVLAEKNTLFESLVGKLTNYPELNSLIEGLLFGGKPIVYNPFNSLINSAEMFGFVKNQNGIVTLSNRIFETHLYNFYLSVSQMQEKQIYKEAVLDKNQFIMNGQLNMRRVLERFVVHFNDLYGDRDEKFIEDEGRKYFLLYLRPIINGVGNYYIESQTRNLKRTDVVVDYRGQQYVIEMKIWHGDEYNNRGEKQLVDYLDAYHLDTGYMVSFNFNKKKQSGMHEVVLGNKLLVEAVV